MHALTQLLAWLHAAGNALGLTHVAFWLNAAANAVGQALTPIGLAPGWLSLAVVGIVTGFVMLIAFKYTSNQAAIKRARREIRANLLAVRLFHDSLAVGFRAQGRVLVAAFRLLLLAVVPMLAMLLPMYLVLAQLALWFQARPMRVGEDTVITMQLGGEADAPWPLVKLAPTNAVDSVTGPVRISSQRQVCWSVRATELGSHRLVFLVDGQPVEKELAIGNGFMPVSLRQPAWDWVDVLLHPREAPFGPDSPVRSIDIEYPRRISWIYGSDYWVIYWFVVALLGGLCLKGVVGVNL